MTVHGLRPEFQPSNFSKIQESTQTQETKKPETIKASTGEHEGIASLNPSPSAITGLGQSVDTKS